MTRQKTNKREKEKVKSKNEERDERLKTGKTEN